MNKKMDGAFISMALLERIFVLAIMFVPLVLELSTILRIEYISRFRLTTRPANKKERASRRLDDKIGWLIPMAVSTCLSC
jgi:quinol-cytochrome oxidoreductase complex cytochrome b subunit